ncbi:hypothetical protein BKA67DRAFT_641888 [Truncatella angustata]|uniref:Cytochrome b5 heme-binding domain-containing protein n=1 Tax=Truncatella angustata TaxID=152316 RepID=A0A9P8UZ64_9PEZI|nr:uncharacterized protein BKA67DRAFT_641888 [Truncatella angustata]KAH6660848.1 hypothetical protein BKA67DRAFT_641888 [Truncatella angustata]
MFPWRRRKQTAPWRRNQKQIPLQRSPWAREFWPSAIPYWSIWGGSLHSFLRPMDPELWPSQMADVRSGPYGMQLPQPDNAWLDRLFVSEELQVNLTHGVRTWQVPVLQTRPEPYLENDRIPRNDADAGWEKYHKARIDIDESTWLDCFSRNRWLDMKLDCTADIVEPSPGLGQHWNNWWTVDNDVIWRALGVSIEIANRILLQLLKDRSTWLDALLFQPVEFWRNRDAHIKNLHKQDSCFDPWILEQKTDSNMCQTTEKLTEQLERYLAYHLWGFFDEDRKVMGFGATYAWWLKTHRGGHDHYPVTMSAVSVGYLRALCSGRLSISEKSNVQVALAATILHELIHALWNGRAMAEFGQKVLEPYMYPEIVKELGQSFENHCVGGLMDINADDAGVYRFNGRTLTLTMAEWPSRYWTSQSDLPTELLGIPELYSNVFLIPTTWSSAFATNFFWDHVVPDFNGGSQAIRAPRIFRAEQSHTWHSFGGKDFPAKRMRLPALDWYSSTWEHLHREWQHRRRTWDEFRLWYQEEYEAWAVTPWSSVLCRIILECFVEAHNKRDLPRCVDLARQFVSLETFYLTTLQQGIHYPLPWIFISLGHLMQTTIPKMAMDHVTVIPLRNGLRLYPDRSWGRGGRGRPIWLDTTDCDAHQTEGVKDPMFNPRQTDAKVDVLDPATIYPTICFREITIEKSNWQNSIQEWKKWKQIWDAELNLHPMPKAWEEAILCLSNTLLAVLNKRKDISNYAPNQWIDFDFQVPYYDNDRNWMQHVQGSLQPEERLVNPPASPTNIATRDFYRSGVFPEPTDPPSGPYYKRRTPASKSATKRRKVMPVMEGTPHIKYYTIGDVGNRLHSGPSTWVVEPDGNSGFDVYDITDSCHRRGYRTGQDIRAMLLHVGVYGASLRTNGNKYTSTVKPWLQSLVQRDPAFHDLLGSRVSQDAEAIRAALGSYIHPLGKLLMPRRQEEIAEYDGEDGMPFWVTIGDTVYNLTNFDASKRDLDTLRHLAQPSKYKANMDLTNNARMMEKLNPYRCAFVQKRPVKFLPTLRTFTKDSLRQSDNPLCGCYTSIGGYVYNLKDYIDLHPGGREIITKYLGREATDFTDWHDLGIMEHYEHLRVGRLVPDIAPDTVEKHQVVIHNWVFDFSGLAPDQSKDEADHWIYANVNKLGGTDASKAIETYDDEGDALERLYRQKDRIVGKVPEKRDLPDIPRGEVKKHNDSDGFRQAWVVFDGLVYNVTMIMLHGQSFYAHEIPRIWAGAEIKDAALSAWLKQDYSHLVIGNLVEGPAWPEPTPVDDAEVERKRRTAELEKYRRYDNIPDDKIVPADIRKWIQTMHPTPEQVHDKIAERRGEFEDKTPQYDAAEGLNRLAMLQVDEGIGLSAEHEGGKRKRGSASGHSQEPRPRKIRSLPTKFGSPVNANLWSSHPGPTGNFHTPA